MTFTKMIIITFFVFSLSTIYKNHNKEDANKFLEPAYSINEDEITKN